MIIKVQIYVNIIWTVNTIYIGFEIMQLFCLDTVGLFMFYFRMSYKHTLLAMVMLTSHCASFTVTDMVTVSFG